MQVDVQGFQEQGYAIVSGLFSDEETAAYRQHYMDMRKGRHPGDSSGVNTSSDDPLKKYPRLIHMHRWDPISLDWMLDQRLAAVFRELIGKEPLIHVPPPRSRQSRRPLEEIRPPAGV